MTPGIYNVRDDFGAVGDGQADDTQAIQAAIDACIGPGDPLKECRQARGVVYLPAGTYRISAPLRIHSVVFLTFRGDSKATRIFPTGILPCVLDINGVAGCVFSDFRIEGNWQEQVQDAIYYYKGEGQEFDQADPDHDNVACGSAGNSFARIWIQSTRCHTGFRIGKLSSYWQTDTTSYSDIWMQGGWNWAANETTWWQQGFAVGSVAWGNNLIHNFKDCVCYSWATGFYTSATNFMLTGGSLGNNGTDFQADCLSYWKVTGIRSENSQRLYSVGAGPVYVAMTHTLEDIVWVGNNIHPDGEVIRVLGWNGTLALRNVHLNTVGAPKCKLLPMTGLTFIIDGMTCRSNTLPGFLGEHDGRVDVHVRGFTEEKADGSGWASTTKGNVISGPVRFLGGGSLEAVGQLPAWRAGDALKLLAFRDDISTQPPPVRAQGQATIPKGKTSVVVEHGLGGQPAPEDVAATIWGPTRVWLGAVDDGALTFRIEKPAPATGVAFTWSATLR